MDTATIVGLVLGVVLVAFAILLGGEVIPYLSAPAFLIVIGGSTAATLTAYPLATFLKMPKVAMHALFSKPQDPRHLIQQLVELAEVARRDGILALESRSEQIQDDFLTHGIQMAVDGTDPEVIQTIMETELDNLVSRHEAGKGLLDSMGRFAPAFGMIGTLIGLVAMLSHMDDPSKIGTGMATALLTTLYGTLLANVIFIPLADKLALRSSEEVLCKTIIIQGVMAIQAGDNPRNVQSKLLTFIPPAIRREDGNRAAA